MIYQQIEPAFVNRVSWDTHDFSASSLHILFIPRAVLRMHLWFHDWYSTLWGQKNPPSWVISSLIPSCTLLLNSYIWIRGSTHAIQFSQQKIQFIKHCKEIEKLAKQDHGHRAGKNSKKDTCMNIKQKVKRSEVCF